MVFGFSLFGPWQGGGRVGGEVEGYIEGLGPVSGGRCKDGRERDRLRFR